MEVDDIITDAQDALFENRIEDLERLCNQALQITKKEPELYDMYCFALQILGRHGEAIEKAIEWSELFGVSFKNLRVILESSYLISDADRVSTAAEVMFKQYNRADNDESQLLWASFASLSAALSADLGFPLDESLFANLHQHFEAEPAVKVYLGWTLIKSGKIDQGVVILQECASSANREDGLAAALIALCHKENGKLEDAKKVWDTYQSLQNTQPLKEVYPIIHGFTDDSEIYAKPASLIIKRRLQQLSTPQQQQDR